MAGTADSAADLQDGRRVIRFTGNLTLLRVRKINEELEAIDDREKLIVDLTEVERMDTVGAWLVHKLQRDHQATLIGATEDQQTLIGHVAAADKPVNVRREVDPPFRKVVIELGTATQTAFG